MSTPRTPHPRACSPLSARTRRRLLRDMLRRAEAGDTSAAEALVRLSIDAEGKAERQSGE